jgi:electron transport complex protein RnfD
LIWGLYCFGLLAALPVLASIVAAVAGEGVLNLLRGKTSLVDGSAFLTGFLIGLSMPPSVPLYVPVLASLFAICIVKGAFGGLGSNWMNPALGGVVFALLNWPGAMGTWSWPRHLAGLAGVSGATPLGFVHQGLGTGPAGDPLSILGGGGYHITSFDSGITSTLNGAFFGFFGVDLPSGYIDLLVGNKAGAIGELSGLLLLLGSVVLISRKVIRWQLPAAILGSFGLMTWIFGGLSYGAGFFSGDILFELLSGSLILVAFFMATDPVTSPSTGLGMVLYGFGIGLLSFAFRRWGSSSEGAAFAVILMNCLVPGINRIGIPKRGRTKEAAHG